MIEVILVMINQKYKKEIISFSFLLPALLLFVIFVVLPFLQGIPISFSNWDGMSIKRLFVGLDNYKRIFTDPNVINATKNTFIFTFFTVVFANLFGLAFAILIAKTSVYNSVLRTLIFMPFCLSLVLASYVWRYVYSDVFYEIMGIPSPLGSPQLVMIGLAVISIWRDAGYCMVIYLAAIQAISPDYYEVAKLEGCSKLKIFTQITLPMIAPAITANITLLLAWGMKVFDYPMAATMGGPGRASETLAMLVYNNLFTYFRAGYGQAIAIVFTIVIFIMSKSVAQMLRSREVEM
jgi:ABC-type sugar transport system permease subunit